MNNQLNLVVLEGHVGGFKSHNEFTVKSKSRENNSKDNKDSIFTISVSGKLSENCQKYLDSGSHVLVSGFLRGDNTIVGRGVRFLPNTKKAVSK